MKPVEAIASPSKFVSNFYIVIASWSFMRRTHEITRASVNMGGVVGAVVVVCVVVSVVV